MGKTFTWTGGEELRAKLDKLAKEYPDAANDSLYEEAEAIMTIAKEKCPVLTGRLMNSGYVSPPSSGEVELGFGVDYAIYVHERTEAQHDNGEAKFLENAINERKEGFEERMIKRIQGRVGL